ncbi:Nif3-like dinuclear metal center hexameric protein [Paenibacillus hunanensis]|uniref:Nif3-like dinuclear metal center hexameric protein n=1 Tax=Paenibacillus hunanensis TaxID=539262 RepID=UPI002A69DF31|nr:Nif3-like dinuclear metal center hexameric protein [Paenibacillus hunanensis]WPP42873.1 Nif3-like dinuclear metal center hexameric protein [Paenibacillus hunanensis]
MQMEPSRYSHTLTTSYTVQQVMEYLFHADQHTMSERQSTGATVDCLETGVADTIVKGIVTAFSASQRVIQQAAAQGANVLVVHEGIFYSHHDQRERLHDDPVYQAKRTLIEQTGMHIIRLHDAIHLERPDGIMEGLLGQLGWRQQVVEETAVWSIVELEQPLQLQQLAQWLKQQLAVSYIRLSGESEQTCQRIAVLVGYRGGAMHGLPLLGRDDIDVLIAGEGPEWELPEYVRDAIEQGRSKGLIMLGHAESEQPGMQWLATRLAAQYEGLPVAYIPNEPVFRVI